MIESLPRWVHRHSRAPLRQTLDGRYAARGSLLCTTWTSRCCRALGDITLIGGLVFNVGKGRIASS